MASLPFSPIRLVLLVTWVYLCFHCVERARRTTLVPPRFRTLTALVSLVAGPLVFLGLWLARRLSEPAGAGDAAPWPLRLPARGLFGRLRRFRRPRDGGDAAIQLFDATGAELKDVYGHGDPRRQAAHVLALTQQVIAEALQRRASDILIDPRDDSTSAVRLRVDGVLTTVRQLEADTCRAVINSIKAVASMDISEKRRPQDGAFTARRGEAIASFRVASAGVLHGEKLSIRVLSQNAGTFRLGDVGFSTRQLAAVQSLIGMPSGMALICGPTGSGKTTTLYAMLNEIDRLTRNVITVEDPIEAELPEASQIEINPRADITFAKALRNMLRHDPDVISVGEIRDEETAEIALRASQTGHLVLATIHCDSNAAALIRLLDLGVSPLLLSSGLSMLVSQRLVRCLCAHCKRPAAVGEELLGQLRDKGIEAAGIFEPAGCDRCGQSGYLGRTAVCDLLALTDQWKANIANDRALIAELRAQGDRKGKAQLRRQGLKKVAAGITTLAEVKRVVG